MRWWFVVFVLLGFCIGLCAGYLITAACMESELVEQHTYNVAGFGGDGWYITTGELRQCLATDAPMWSDAWCENCYRIWAIANERR